MIEYPLCLLPQSIKISFKFFKNRVCTLHGLGWEFERNSKLGTRLQLDAMRLCGMDDKLTIEMVMI